VLIFFICDNEEFRLAKIKKGRPISEPPSVITPKINP
jgi:hypothetical protein